MKQKLEQIKNEALSALADICDEKELDNLRVKFLGKKGELTSILKQMGSLSPEERPIIGQLANKIRAEIENNVDEASKIIKEKATEL